MASITARSAAGSLMRTPPTALTNTSWSHAGHAGMAVQHRQQHRQAVAVQAHAQAPRAGAAAVDQRLDLHQQRPRALQRDQHAAAGHRLAVGGQEDRARVADALQPALGHREHADLVDRAEAVLDGAHQAEAAECVSPSKYSTVSTMCSSTRGPASAPSLVTWPTSTMQQPLALAARVSCAAHSRTWATEPGALSELVGIHRLDRVDHAEGRLLGLQRGEDLLQLDLGQHPHLRVAVQARGGARAAPPGRRFPRR
jgi:hypothetical protein